MNPRYLLPPDAYLSADWFEREQASLFDHKWSLVASSEDLAGVGAYATTVIGRAPVVVIRGRDGLLRAFQNMCRHRGMVLLAGTGTVERQVRCSYHEWRYGLDGALEVVPQRKEQFPDIDISDLGLLPASVEVWEGMVFAHPDPDAPPLGDALQGVAGHIGSHTPGLLTEVATRRLEARCNWKLFVENHVDVYHLWYLHSATLADFDHTRFEHAQDGANWTSYEPLKHGDVASATLTAGTEQIEHLDNRDRMGLGAHLVFPNLMMASAAEFFATYVVIPVAPDRSVIDLRLRAQPGADAGAVAAAAVSFIEEDIRACEAVQQAVASPSFRVGPLAVQHERPIETFHTHVLEAIGEKGCTKVTT